MKTKVIDAHVHFYDHKANKYPFLDVFSPGFASFVGDYAALPRIYLLNDYLKDAQDFQVEGMVWHEFVAADPVKELEWANARAQGRQALVAQVDFLDPHLQKRLQELAAMPRVTAVREHLEWDEGNPLKRFAKRSDLMSDPKWLKGLSLLEKFSFPCALEIFSPQLPAFFKVAKNHPKINFTLPLMGWPVDLSEKGFREWKKILTEISQLDNVCVKISALECIFGLDWSVDKVRPWILETIALFGPERCMFGSHMPIGRLSRSFNELYRAYNQIVSNFSPQEKDSLFRQTAAKYFKIFDL